MHNKSVTLPKAPFSAQEVLTRLQASPEAYRIFLSLNYKCRREFLDFCSGKTGIYLCYDIFFKTIFDPYLHPERLEKLISPLLGQEVKIIDIIPNEGFHMSDRGSFVVADIVVRLADNTILNIEIQKSGYHFPGQRFDCYCADLIMREYNRLRNQNRDHFSYSKMPPVLSIALIENSTKEFYKYPDHYIHRVKMISDTGIELNNLTRHIYVALDIFHMFMQNKPIETPLEAWLMLLTTRDLKRIEELIPKHPDFAEIYQEIFELRTKPEELIHMFSKVLLEGDRNMERFMIDEFKQEVEQARLDADKAKQDADKARQLADKANQDADRAKQLADKANQDADRAKQDADKARQLASQKSKELETERSRHRAAIDEKDAIIAELQAKLASLNKK